MYARDVAFLRSESENLYRLQSWLINIDTYFWYLLIKAVWRIILAPHRPASIGDSMDSSSTAWVPFHCCPSFWTQSMCPLSSGCSSGAITWSTKMHINTFIGVYQLKGELPICYLHSSGSCDRRTESENQFARQRAEECVNICRHPRGSTTCEWVKTTTLECNPRFQTDSSGRVLLCQ